MFKLSRREMLERSMLAAAAAVTAQGVPSVGVAFEGSTSPNEKLRIAVVGCNGRGGEHINEWLKRKDCEIVAICDVDESVGQRRIADIEKRSGQKPKYYQDLRKCFEDKNVDIASIATPNHWHALAAIWAIQAGKDVYVEKPVSHNVLEGRRIVQAARKHKKIVQTGTQCRSMGGTIEAIKFIKDGGVGEVKLARGLCYKPRGAIGARGNYDVPASIDYDIWLGPAAKKDLSRPKLHYDWHWQWDYGNGDLGNQGIHQMDIARWGLGENTVGQGVLSYGGRFGYEDAGETANTQVCIHDFGDKKLVFEVRGLKTERYMGAGVGVIFHGTDGYVSLASYTGGAAFDKDGKKTKDFNAGGDHFGNFVNAVRARDHKLLNADIEEGHLSSALCHLGNISYRLGSPMAAKEVQEKLGNNAERQETFERFAAHLTENKVDLGATKVTLGPDLKLDGAKEVFVGNLADKANPMLTREYRAPYVVPDEASL